MKGILRAIGYFALYFVITTVIQALLTALVMAIGVANGIHEEQLLVDYANNNILGITVFSGLFTILIFYVLYSDLLRSFQIQEKRYQSRVESGKI